MKKGPIKFQIFLALVVFLFLSGCVGSKKQIKEEPQANQVKEESVEDTRDLQIQALRAQVAELSKEKKGDSGKRIGELEREILEKTQRIKSLEESLAKMEKSDQEAADKLKAANEKITKELANLRGVSVKEEKGKLTITILDKILFDSGKVDIKKVAIPVLSKLANILKEHSNREVLIEGHTDNVPIHTSLFPSNWELSTRRATTVLQYFIWGHKISPKRFSAAGYSEFKPVATNSTATGRAENRRVEVILLPPDFVWEKKKLQ